MGGWATWKACLGGNAPRPPTHLDPSSPQLPGRRLLRTPSGQALASRHGSGEDVVFLPRAQVAAGQYVATGASSCWRPLLQSVLLATSYAGSPFDYPASPPAAWNRALFARPPSAPSSPTRSAIAVVPRLISPVPSLPTCCSPPLVPSAVQGASDESSYKLLVEKHRRRRRLAGGDAAALREVRRRARAAGPWPGRGDPSRGALNGGSSFGAKEEYPGTWLDLPASWDTPADNGCRFYALVVVLWHLPRSSGTPPTPPPTPLDSDPGWSLLRPPRLLRHPAHRPGRRRYRRWYRRRRRRRGPVQHRAQPVRPRGAPAAPGAGTGGTAPSRSLRRAVLLCVMGAAALRVFVGAKLAYL
jgi:hypothetical protein